MYGPTGDRFFEIHTNGSWEFMILLLDNGLR